MKNVGIIKFDELIDPGPLPIYRLTVQFINIVGDDSYTDQQNH